MGKETSFCPDHNPVQHRDAKPPWCRNCGLTEDGKFPESGLSKAAIAPSQESYQDKAIRLVCAHENKRMAKSEQGDLTPDMVYVVWFAKTLQNFKVILASVRPDGMLYEVTYNGDACETYVDSYKKWENSIYPDGQDESEVPVAP